MWLPVCNRFRLGLYGPGGGEVHTSKQLFKRSSASFSQPTHTSFALIFRKSQGWLQTPSEQKDAKVLSRR